MFNRSGLYPKFYPDEICRKSSELTPHDPPLLYNLNHDPGELNPLGTTESPYKEIVAEIDKVRSLHYKVQSYITTKSLPTTAMLEDYIINPETCKFLFVTLVNHVLRRLMHMHTCNTYPYL